MKNNRWGIVVEHYCMDIKYWSKERDNEKQRFGFMRTDFSNIFSNKNLEYKLLVLNDKTNVLLLAAIFFPNYQPGKNFTRIWCEAENLQTKSMTLLK